MARSKPAPSQLTAYADEIRVAVEESGSDPERPTRLEVLYTGSDRVVLADADLDVRLTGVGPNPTVRDVLLAILRAAEGRTTIAEAAAAARARKGA